MRKFNGLQVFATYLLYGDTDSLTEQEIIDIHKYLSIDTNSKDLLISVVDDSEHEGVCDVTGLFGNLFTYEYRIFGE